MYERTQEFGSELLPCGSGMYSDSSQGNALRRGVVEIYSTMHGTGKNRFSAICVCLCTGFLERAG